MLDENLELDEIPSTFDEELHKSNNLFQMKIPDELKKKWDDLRSFGDGKKIAEAYEEVNEVDVSRAFNTGECSDEVFHAMADFFKKKEDSVKQYL